MLVRSRNAEYFQLVTLIEFSNQNQQGKEVGALSIDIERFLTITMFNFFNVFDFNEVEPRNQQEPSALIYRCVISFAVVLLRSPFAQMLR